MDNKDLLFASHLLIEGEVDSRFPSYLRPRQICTEIVPIPVLNLKFNEEREMALVDIKYFSNIKWIISGLIKQYGYSDLGKFDFKEATLIFSFIKKTGEKTKIVEQTYLKFYQTENKVCCGTMKGFSLNNPVLFERKKKMNLNKLADLHELDEIENESE